MQPSWLVVLPPIIVVVLATLTRRVLFSLLMGIMTAALIVQNFQVVPACLFIGQRMATVMELYKLASWHEFWTCSNLFICAFLIVLGVLITMIRVSGAAYAYGNFLMGRLKDARSAEQASLILSTYFFIDDYFSCFTVGSVMQSITDRFNVPRVKLALLVNAIAAPLAVIIPLSSWVAEIVGQLRNSGVSLVSSASGSTLMIADPLSVYINTIPFMFYAFIIIASLWYMVFTRLSFGLLAQQEHVAQKTGNLYGGKIPVARPGEHINAARMASSSLVDFIFPILGLLVTVVFWILYTGNWWVFGGNNTIFQAMLSTNIFAGLFVGSLVACCATFIFFLAQKKLTLTEIPLLLKEGYQLMGGSLVMLALIWTLSTILSKDLETGKYLANVLVGHLDIAKLPMMFFLIAALISTLMGTAWGTIGMLIPLGLGMVPLFAGLSIPFNLSDAPMALPLIGAIITGSIVGNHLSPISDVMLMSAMSAGSYHLDLVKSQISFTLPAVISSTVAFWLVGITLPTYGIATSAMVSLLAGILSNIFLLYLSSFMYHLCKK